MGWNLDDSRPIWPQLKERLMKDIVGGRYVMGGPFPTVRDLAEEAGVNRNTMQRALSELESEGLVITNRTAGRTVTTDEELVAETKAAIAADNVGRFMDEMASLGFSAEEVIDIIKKKGVENR
ncbi:MAG: GntR family transcriptional regulator [Firmicutes bacterium]|nr:GntR family transcriptional regulator [Bacillota bacterium]MBQ4596162.1 GntR family transcriptional regulator [Bacillota bacterium]